MRHRLYAVLALVCLLVAPAAAQAARTPTYDVDYLVRFLPGEKAADVTIRVRQGSGSLRTLDLDMPAARYTRIEGDGGVERDGDRVVWDVPDDGGALRYRYEIDRRRRDGGYDARITDDWVIVRGDSLVPSARTRTTRGARSEATLRFELPADWGVDTQWEDIDRTSFRVSNPDRSLARPTGWVIAGELGIRRERLDGTLVSVAAPRGDAMRRNEILAMLNLVLPEMKESFGSLPPKLLIVGAGDPMWRGGLSAPMSLYMHSARPLISENGSSTLVHEVVHVVTRVRGAGRDRWIGEGIADYYGMRLLNQVGMLSDSRYARAIEWMEDRGKDIDSLEGTLAQGALRARAVILFRDLDAEIREATDGERDLDGVVRELMKKGSVRTADVRAAAEAVLGRPARTLDTPLLDY
ncbi:hypothetical protein [Coralloluteibacterium thermophilus]|uniref:Peptidase M61 catalytic domain-containing protein n=1 Tax=Coralloluteibacterium thermophilum TaxID=2707049 RepID=A0ABV9NSC2_9GAMM